MGDSEFRVNVEVLVEFGVGEVRHRRRVRVALAFHAEHVRYQRPVALTGGVARVVGRVGDDAQGALLEASLDLLESGLPMEVGIDGEVRCVEGQRGIVPARFRFGTSRVHGGAHGVGVVCPVHEFQRVNALGACPLHTMDKAEFVLVSDHAAPHP